MLKKCVSSLCALLLLTGCANSASSTTETSSVSQEVTYDSAKEAADIVNHLGLTDSMTQMKDRTVLGMFFNGDKDAFEDATVYLSSDNGNANTVGVFYTNDMEKCEQYLKSYLETQKAQTQTYFQSEVFKISNAVLEKNENKIVLIINEDIEQAKQEAQNILG